MLRGRVLIQVSSTDIYGKRLRSYFYRNDLIKKCGLA